MQRRILRFFLAVAAALVLGNGIILGAFAVARSVGPEPDLAIEGVDNERIVSDRLWRGDAPSIGGYRQLAEQGVTTIVDLRAERDLMVPEQVLDDLDLDRIAIPIRDGQIPEASEAERFIKAVEEAPGTVFVHCGAGVGRTGVMSAMYLVESGEASGWEALGRNLSVGPPSLEQIVYAGTLEDEGGQEMPPGWLQAVSRVLDAPRRIWSVVRS